MKRAFKLYWLFIIPVTFFFVACKQQPSIQSTNNNINHKVKENYTLNKSLSAKDYASIQGYTPKEGFVPTSDIAFQIADIVLSNIYGKDKIESEKPFSINLDGDIWVVEGSLPQGSDGGVAYIEINKKTGEILKIIHTK